MVKIEKEEVRVGKVRCLLQTAGPSETSEAVVFVHGNPGCSEDWTDLLGHVGEAGRAIAPDMPGYGRSDRPRDFDYTRQGYAAHLERLLEQLGIRRVHLALHDLGGFWGLTWAAQHVERVASVTLLNVGVMPGYRWHKFARVWRTPVIGELFQLAATRFSFRALLEADNPKPFPPGFADAIYDRYDWDTRRAVLKFYRATSDLQGMADEFAAALRPRRLPGLVIWGDGDKYSPVRFAEVQQEYFNAEVHVLPGCGHWSMIDEPERVRSLVVPFLRAQLGQA